MLPERDLASEFWLFVYQNAKDPRLRTDGEYEVSVKVRAIEIERYGRYQEDVGRLSSPLEDETTPYINPLSRADEGLIYETLQHALLGYLMDLSHNPGHHLYCRSLRISYTMWLRIVSLVMADAAREPSRLTIMSGTDYASESSWESHSLRIAADDWSILLEDTFNYVCSVV